MSELSARIEALCGPGVAACAVRVGQGGPLAAVERPAMARAVPARRAEFAAGRDAARGAMHRLGLPACAIPMRPDRSPLWPHGLSGSISHDATLAVAAVRRGGRALGIDIASATPLESAIWDEIADADEIGQPVPGFDPGRVAGLVFAAKEAAYKAQFPATGRVLGFDAMRIEIAGNDIAARLRQTVGPYAVGTVLRGRWAVIGARLVVAIDAPDVPCATGPGFKPRNTELPASTGMVSRSGMR